MSSLVNLNGAKASNRDRKIVVIGWDAATWDLLFPWVRADHLPNLAGLMHSGSHGTITSTPVPVSPAAWSTIVTGQNPGKHGVFDWFQRKPNTYDVEYVNTGHLRAKPLWQYFNDAGKKTGIFNVPMLYPATPVNGFMISGMAAPNAHADDFTYPAELIAELEANVGSYPAEEREIYRYGREHVYFQSMLEWLDYQERAIEYLIEAKPCDLYFFVFMQPDHAQHKLWRYIDPRHPDHDPDRDPQYKDMILNTYQALDNVLGNLIARFDEDTTFVVLSDHGAGPAHGVMYINRWLEETGLLHLRNDARTRVKYLLAKSDFILQAYRLLAHLGLGRVAQLASKPVRDKVLNSFLTFDDIDWDRTRAYSRGVFGQIFINLKGREPKGIVESGAQYERVVEKIIAGLENLRHPETSEPLITDIRRRDAIYEGPYVEQAADIVFSIQGYLYEASVKLGFERNVILGSSEYEDSGSHRPDGILVMTGPDIQRGVELHNATVADILPTLLTLADLPIPSGLDGRPLLETLTEAPRARIRFKDQRGREDNDISRTELTPHEVAELENRLRHLGYLG